MNQSCRELSLKAQSCQSSIHTFLLQPFDKTSYYQQIVAIDFSPIYDEQGRQFRVLPTFNQDGNIEAPAFLTQLDRKNSKIFGKLSNQPSKTVSESMTLEKAPIYYPKPRKNYCYVCKEPYLDYIKHIDHKIHQKNLKANRFSVQIDQLVKYYKKTKLNSRLMKNFSRNNSLDEQSYKQHNPKKRRIVETTRVRGPIRTVINKEATSESTHISHFNGKCFATDK